MEYGFLFFFIYCVLFLYFLGVDDIFENLGFFGEWRKYYFFYGIIYYGVSIVGCGIISGRLGVFKYIICGEYNICFYVVGIDDGDIFGFGVVWFDDMFFGLV